MVAVSDSSGAAFHSGGPDIDRVAVARRGSGTVASSPDCESIAADDMLTLDVDIFVPAALENAITEDNAEKVQARAIFEVANSPITARADAMLSDQGTVVVPDVLVNAGGVLVSYFEWGPEPTGNDVLGARRRRGPPVTPLPHRR